MKKSIIVLALALLMVGSVFSANTPLTATGTVNQNNLLDSTGVSTSTSTEPKDTTVKIQLNQYPKYMTAITTGNYDGSDVYHMITNVNYTTIPHVEEIEMTVDKDSWILNKTTASYFVTFFAYENTQNVKFTVSLDSNLILDESTATKDATVSTSDVDSTNQKQIRYEMTIEGIDGAGNAVSGSSVTLHSCNQDSAIIRKIASTNLIGYSTYGSYAFSLKGEGTDTVQNNIAGLYKSTITLNIASY